jgi:hypothetical protein
MSIIEYNERYGYIRLLEELLDDVLVLISKIYMGLIDKDIISYFRKAYDLDITNMETFMWYGRMSTHERYRRLITVRYYDKVGEFDIQFRHYPGSYKMIKNIAKRLIETGSLKEYSNFYDQFN